MFKTLVFGLTTREAKDGVYGLASLRPYKKWLYTQILALMKILKICVLFLLTLGLKIGYTQKVPLSQSLIEDGHRYLAQGNLADAKQSFSKAKQLFSSKKSVVNDAQLGLSDYHLAINDTAKSIHILRSVIGENISRKIEDAQFSGLKKTKKDAWSSYYATTKRIKIALKQQDFRMAKNYLKYLKKYVRVSWYCGNGAMGHHLFIDRVKGTLKVNGY
ncbi:hypothetical protein BKI52_30405 [marine bacterium AO1-C]|nr:hypothetical protein BKI52_30405 [marine bacterium AO1-C]